MIEALAGKDLPHTHIGMKDGIAFHLVLNCQIKSQIN